MPSSKDKVKKELSIIKKASLIAPVLCAFLILLGIHHRNNGDLLQAFILYVASVVIVILYYIGARRFLRIFNDSGGMDDNEGS